MPSNRFYIQDHFEKGKELYLEGNEFHHLVKVMRQKEKDIIELVNGKHLLAKAKILALNKKKAKLLIDKIDFFKPALPPFFLAQALPKLPHLEWIIQKGTELGVSTFYLFPSERSEKKLLSSHQRQRLFQITVNAMKQCGRFDLPTLHFFPSLEKLILPKGTPFFGDLTANTFLPKITSSYLLFIGPEKGFSEKETFKLKNNFKAEGISLHPYTLRSETASIAAMYLAAFYSTIASNNTS